MSRIVIYGAGGFGREVLTTARGHQNVVLADDRVTGPGIIRTADIAPDDQVVIAVGDSEVRRRIAIQPLAYGTVIAPTAIIGSNVTIGEGGIICDFAMVTASARIGRHFHANIYSYVAHDCVIGDFVTFAPKVCCNGNVHIEDGAYIGTGAVLRQGTPDRPLRIGRGAVIGMGAVVTKDVPAGETWVGNPAQPIVRRPKLAA